MSPVSALLLKESSGITKESSNNDLVQHFSTISLKQVFLAANWQNTNGSLSTFVTWRVTLVKIFININYLHKGGSSRANLRMLKRGSARDN